MGSMDARGLDHALCERDQGHRRKGLFGAARTGERGVESLNDIYEIYEGGVSWAL